MSLDLKKILTNAITSGSVGLDELKDLFIDLFDDLRRSDKEMYDELTLKIYEHIYGCTIPKEYAEEIVKQMKPYGEKWNYEQVQNYNKGYNKSEFYLVMNMFYNDYGKIIGNDNSNYVRFTEAWFDDIDGKENKTFNYFMKK